MYGFILRYNSFRNYICERSYEFAEDVTRIVRGSGFTEAEQMQVRLFTKGIAYIYEDWTFGRIHLNEEDAAHALFLCMPEQLRELWR